jgi:hypothetical protein
VQSVLEAVVNVQRAPMGDFAFALPGVDEVRAVEGQGVQAWWLDGTGDARRLLVRMGDLREGTRQLRVRLERRLGGTREAIDVPRMFLTGAQAEKGLLLLFALPDVAPAPTSAAGLRSLPPSRLEGQAAEVPGARATHAYEWDAAHASPLRVALRTPDREVEAVVVTQASPSDEEQRLEHLVVFDVRRGAVDRLRLFVPDGGLAANDVVRARDLRELRSEPAVRKDADGGDVKGLLYTLRLQSMKSGLVEVTVSQLWPAATALRVLRPEDVKATRWFSLVRTFLDGEVDARPGAGAPDEVAWADVPFLPTGLERASVLKSWAARAPFTLEVTARRHRLEAQSEAVVLAAHAEVVVGLDGEARARVRYRLFNRSRQFLRLKLPDGVVLYGASAAGRPVKPLAGVGGTVLLPVPKVPLGGRGYEVVLSYRARAGDDLRAGRRATLPLPTVVDVEVDRTTVTLRLPEPLDYDFDTRMTPASEREALADEVEASLREAQEVLKVAETGTLEQRMFACDNSTPIVAEAARKLADYKAQGARPDRLQGLAMDLDRLTAAQQVAQARCQVDAGEAWSRVQFETKLAQGANANGQTLVVLDEAKTVTRPSGGGGGGGGGSEANWRFNFGAAAGEVGKEDLAELKGRLQRGLELRDEVERSKQVDVTAATEARAKAPPSQQAAEDPATRTYDMSRNSLVLNEELRRVQTDGRQLGTSAAPADDRQSREQSRERRATDYDGESQSESGLAYPDAPAPDGDRRRLPAGEVLLRAGLMGIDVPLPRDGRTFWFVGVRTGSPIALEASEPGTPTWLRTLLAVVLWGALAAGLVRLRRRFAPAAA